MKANVKCYLAYICTSVLLATPLSIQAQSTHLDSWSSLVQSKTSNPIVIDTFMLQTFQGRSIDNWNYTVSGQKTIEDITDLDVASFNAHGTKALKLQKGSAVSFKSFNLAANVFDSAHIAIHRCEFFAKGEQCAITFTREGQTNTVSSKNSSEFKGLVITKNPTQVSISMPDTLSSTSYLLIDSAMAYGYNRQYTLFTGSGAWADNDRWSHLPARRSNTALVQGHLSLQDKRTTQTIQISEGSLQIASTGTLHTNALTLYDAKNSHASLTTFGQLEINNRLTVEKIFPDKGKWYFFSLPFDLYADDIENFTFKDNTETGSGDYFYLQTYDGQKRANGQPGWRVVSASQTTDQPIIHKHQGYLIALDAAASTTTMRFHCPSEQIPDGFGKSVSLYLDVATGGNEGNNGWVLCGNPLPAPLPLRNIKSTDVLDGYIYLYQKGAYQAYSLDSDYAIAPYTAFFVKASEATVLEVSASTEAISSARLLACESPLRASQEPENHPTSNQTILPTSEVRIIQEPHQIRIEQLPEAGTATWFNAQGQIIQTAFVPSGSSTLRYPSSSGFYLLHLQAGSWKHVQKVSLRFANR